MKLRRRHLAPVRDYSEASAGQVGRIRRIRNWWWSSPTVLLTCLVFLIVLVVGSVLVAVLPSKGLTGGQQATTPGQSGPTPPVAVFIPGEAPQVAPPAGGATGCKPTEAIAMSPEVLAAAAFNTQWVSVGAASVPVSPTGGGYSTDPVFHCYSRTPEGALYAAAAFMAEYAASDAAGRVKLLQAVGVQEGTYTAMLASLQQQVAKGTATGPITDRMLVGYRWTRYQPDNAAVQLVYRFVAGSMANQLSYTSTVTVIWDRAANDWRVVTPGPNGMPTAVLRTTETYTPWGAEAQ